MLFAPVRSMRLLGAKGENMGMFDYLRCHYPLPVEGGAALEYQTKDTPAQWLDQYEIRTDGTLWHQDYDTEDRSDPSAEGFARLFGCATRVNERWEPVALTGEVVFYSGDFEFSAYFVRGELKHLETLQAPNCAIEGPEQAQLANGPSRMES